MRQAAEEDLERQRARIAQLDVRCDVTGAVVSIDGIDVATTPLAEPLAVSAGDHVVAVRAAGYDQTSRAVQIAGRTRTELAFELRPVARGILRIRSPLPGVEVQVDDRVVGSTPLATTVPVAPGSHVVVGRRAGYSDARVEVSVDMAAEREVSLEPELDPSSVGELATLRLRIPHVPARARIDGREHDPTRALELPFGPHAVELEVEGREPWRGTAQLEPGSELVLRVELRWSEDARRARLDAASTQSATGWALTGAGGALAIASAIVLGWNESRVEAATLELSELRRCFEDSMGDAARRDQLCPPSYDERADQNDALFAEIEALRGVFGATVGLAALAAVTGLVLALTAPDEGDIDRAASAELRVGPGSVAVRGTF
ncbi:MAG: PEGA domain-containing protein [Sandaracinaceae bacterium]|nr:PEGA domain-containing protein [Sandaracinaceae bacterium]